MTVLAVAHQAGAGFGRVGADGLFVWLGTPARDVWHDDVPTFELRKRGEQLVVPGEAVYIDFHDPQVWSRRSEVHVHHRRQVALEIVRCDIHLERIGGSGDLERLPHPIPYRVNDRDIHRLLAKIGQEIAQADQGFARADRVRA